MSALKSLTGHTVSARYLRYGIGIAVGLLFMLAVILAAHERSRISFTGYAETPLSLGGKRYHLFIADTAAKQTRGLGLRASLPNDDAMVFPYGQSQNLCFWMKDMHFPIDMVWADGQRRVVAIESNVSPDTYPKTYCHNASYVLEFNAGVAKQAGLRPGSPIDFKL